MASSTTQGAIRIGDHDRADAADRLTAHAAAGRLTMGELEERLEQAHRAISIRDLQAIEADLPATAPRRAVRPPVASIAIALVVAAVLGSAVVGHPLVPLFVVALIVGRTGLRAPRHALARGHW